MLAFHKRHYRPDNMTVVIVGPQPLSVIHGWIVPRFSRIRNSWTFSDLTKLSYVERLIDEAAKDAPADSYSSPSPSYNSAFRPELQGGTWPVLLTTLPIKSMRKLALFFPLPAAFKNPDRSPIGFISHLLGHEGPGSSFAILQDTNLASAVTVGYRIAAADQVSDAFLKL